MKQIQLKNVPEQFALPTENTFELCSVPVPNIAQGECLVKVLALSVAPVQLRFLTNTSVASNAISIGDYIPGRGVGIVIKSKSSRFSVGDFIQGPCGWREYATIQENNPLAITMNCKDLPIRFGVSTLGITGMSALIGLNKIAKITKKDTVVISGVLGGVGSQVAQIARIKKCKKVIGICGSTLKCELAKKRLNIDEAINYNDPDFLIKLEQAVGNGVDIFFDNVGGEILDNVLLYINRKARIVACGGISQYLLDDKNKYQYKNIWKMQLHDALYQSFMIYDYVKHFYHMHSILAEYVREYKITPLEDISYGLESITHAINDLYLRKNIGARIVVL
ncbi:MAG: NADP-dependent oxidoreductase [Methylacidiphilales bacterium]|nr:NADP-dependent oxidoreductase [Candidatus Methylacidiphilales bacterium]